MTSLWLTTLVISSFSIGGGFGGYALSGLVLTLLIIIAKPLLKILFLPITIITFGLLSWVINVAVLYIFTYLVPWVTLAPWTFPGFSQFGFAIPAMRFTYVVTLVIVSITLTIFSNLLNDLAD